MCYLASMQNPSIQHIHVPDLSGRPAALYHVDSTDNRLMKARILRHEQLLLLRPGKNVPACMSNSVFYNICLLGDRGLSAWPYPHVRKDYELHQ